ncbi:MAG: hypothetical protein HY716_04825 [Planctomycetes bacterium]|nr:hypothetical protein [Planctomycetota bacterium]
MRRASRRGDRVDFNDEYQEQALRFLAIPGLRRPDPGEWAHIFACFFQIRRAFFHLYSNIIGSTMPASRLRAEVWRAVFTHDMRRYRRSLYTRMGEIATLITGPSGSGKELVARAIEGRSGRAVHAAPVRGAAGRRRGSRVLGAGSGTLDRRAPRSGWPGNFRKLEQCVRNVLVRRQYRPLPPAARSPTVELGEAVAAGRLSVEELLWRYTTLVYAQTSNYQETARRLGLDRRTVRSRIDPDFPERQKTEGLL